jgi:penicillin amidase
MAARTILCVGSNSEKSSPILPEDVLGRMSGVYMTQNLTREVARAQLVAAVGPEKARWLAPTDPARDFAPAAGLDLAGIDQRVLAGYRAATKLLSSLAPSKSESNNWVVHGSRLASGKPLLASDPHRAIALPSLRYLVHLNAPGWNVIGSGEPGLPGVAIGHNEKIAWGFTIVRADQTDLVVVNTDPRVPSRYQTDTGWEAMKVVREDVLVKGKGKRPIELRFTRHGPVLFHDAKTNLAFALRWVGSEPGGAAYLASLAVDRAGNRKEFLAALSRWKIPRLNFVYADTYGEIGWAVAARVPIRKGHDGLLPVPGSEAFEWKGYLRVAQLPQTWNPKEGFVATANHKILPKDYPHTIGFEFAAPYRYRRLSTALAGRERWRLEDFQALQQDHVSLAARDLVGVLAKVDLGDGDSREGPLYAAWLKEVKSAMLGLHLPAELHKACAEIVGVPVLIRALADADPRWFGKDAKAARDRLVRETFAVAVKKAKALPDRWGALHTVTFRHPLSNVNPAYASAFNLGPVERPGDEHCINNTRDDDNFRQVHGATYRHLIDLADWDRALATSAPGQSGQPGSPHYGDLLPLWGRGEYFPLAFSRKKVESVTKQRLWLRPAAKKN